jgi:Lar family restriction alleviation protein
MPPANLEPTLRPCPFCGEASVTIARNLEGTAHWAVCDGCRVELDTSPTDEEARRIWNQRALLTDEAAVERGARAAMEAWNKSQAANFGEEFREIVRAALAAALGEA